VTPAKAALCGAVEEEGTCGGGAGMVRGVSCSGRFLFASPVAGRNLAVLSPTLEVHRSGKK